MIDPTKYLQYDKARASWTLGTTCFDSAFAAATRLQALGYRGVLIEGQVGAFKVSGYKVVK